MSLEEIYPQWYNTTDDDRKNTVPGLEALGPDLVPAWRDLGNVDRLCDRCQAIPWQLFHFEEHDFDDPLTRYSTSTNSSDSKHRRASYLEHEAVLHDFYASHEWENTESYIDGNRRRWEFNPDLDSRSDTSTSHRWVNMGKGSVSSSDVAQDTDDYLTGNPHGDRRRAWDSIGEIKLLSERESSLPRENPSLAKSDNIYPFEGLRGRSSTRSNSERNRHSTSGASRRQTEYDSTRDLNGRGTNSQEQSQLDRSLTISIGSAKSEDIDHYVGRRRSTDSFGDGYLSEEVFRRVDRRHSSSSSGRPDGSDASFQYFGHIFRPHVSRPDPMGPYIKFWARSNAPSLATVREAAHRGCHLCSMIMTSLLVGRSNHVFGTSLGGDTATEVFDDDEVLLCGRVIKSKSNGSYTRYLAGHIRRTGSGVDGINFRFSVLDKEELGNLSPTVCQEVTAATQAGSIAKFWLHDCLSNHCCSADQIEDPLLPSRVIVVRGVDGGAEPFLLESNSIRAKYAALSYCWGQCKLFRTTQATYAERCVSIPRHTLPRTFRDAISMTSALGLDYLWIDAMCIIQDSAEDCQRELGSMAQIYTSSTITIAAVGAISADSGFPLSRNKLAMVDCRVSLDTVISADFMGQDYILDSGTLHSRAWCFQEVQLSPRLLSCGAKELYFQCHHGVRREGRPFEFLIDYENEVSDTESDDPKPDRLRFCDYPPMTDVSDIYFKWYNCVRTYTQLDLTYSNDRLTAISGLASRLPMLFENDADRPTPQDYLAGLWRADLLNGLLRDNLYSHPRQRQPVVFQAPSWSWAASEAETWHFRTQASEFCCQVLEATVTPVSGLNPFGPVRSGKITLYGPVVPLSARAFYEDEFDKDPANINRRGMAGRMVDWDHDISRDLGCVCLLFTLNDALVLSPVSRPGARTGVFQRVGIMNDLPWSWKEQLRHGKTADVEYFDVKSSAVTII